MQFVPRLGVLLLLTLPPSIHPLVLLLCSVCKVAGTGNGFPKSTTDNLLKLKCVLQEDEEEDLSTHRTLKRQLSIDDVCGWGLEFVLQHKAANRLNYWAGSWRIIKAHGGAF